MTSASFMETEVLQSFTQDYLQALVVTRSRVDAASFSVDRVRLESFLVPVRSPQYESSIPRVTSEQFDAIWLPEQKERSSLSFTDKARHGIFH